MEDGLAKGVDQGQGFCRKIAPDPVVLTLSCFYPNYYYDLFLKTKTKNKQNFSSITSFALKEEEGAKEPLTLLV